MSIDALLASIVAWAERRSDIVVLSVPGQLRRFLGLERLAA
jgi:hypothetical protein